MQKYKRAKKYPGKRSIPLRNPRRVDWHRLDIDNNTLVSIKPRLSDGISKESFAPSNRKLSLTVVEQYTQLVIFSDKYQCLTLFYKAKVAYFEHVFFETRRKFTSREYSNSKEAIAKHRAKEVRFIKTEWL